MIILISAVGSTGKTLMAQKLLEKYHITYLSIVHVKMGLYRGDPNCPFTPLDRTEEIGYHLWPIVKGIIMTNLENEQQMIIEGAYLLPHYMHDLDIPKSEEIIPVFFGFSEKYIQNNFEDKITKYRNTVEGRRFPEERMINELIEEHKDFKDECVHAGVRYFEIKHDYDNEIAQVYQYIDAEKRSINSK